ncbi:MAG: hypothetical protein A3C50_02160 [Candidatus Staskawiczbacteria bacterium RIFCSPHIGHO2_02_FULL_43_16]|uniref:Uncharacterized protein n=1 Tax=Candidatus Staskawiczbacteria bacterium RIFCSPHIGHO2_01_FULL_41_41 TaxID=1802203 RepID=A0A1G2HXX1_9BACT|nr:MAG: hypothetical protein A2822_00530 [Candidatus Staskawiczbacteria bacterium RIFCSPHIGHO2_01_FULL_41_41]OGZ68481.1 MAG: hypothetical protein A3C50_02160 [Candidatus Staskawiczbacteria bacterium RIFCSPHIGHO2_02_FULL_43_16]OGZ74285.1 MAG: hypothetical protein A3A12_02595 [Candidatus Staskawiczbacteria bacterium RIFCSPLOWO2_01_FULL_43_17b]
MSFFDQIAIRIIKEQELIIGPVAWDEAKKVSGLQMTGLNHTEISVQNGDPKVVINKLVEQYENIFGKASHEVCKEAVQDLIAEMPDDQIPSSLKQRAQ